MKSIIFILGFSFFLFSCGVTEENVDNSSACKTAIVDSELYLNSASDEFEIRNMAMEDTCLKITIAYGGGCGESSAELIDSGIVLDSDPIQRNLRFVFSDKDLCEALITENFFFDLKNLEFPDASRILLKFKNTNRTVLYEY